MTYQKMSEQRTEEPTFAELVAALPWERDEPSDESRPYELVVRCDCGLQMTSDPMTEPDEVHFGCSTCQHGATVCFR
jgi:hypothetical protein